MDNTLFLVIAVAALAVLAGLLGLMLLRGRGNAPPDAGLLAEKAGLEARMADLQSRLEDALRRGQAQEAELASQRQRVEDAVETRARAQTELAGMAKTLSLAQAAREAAEAARAAAEQARHQAEQQAALARQQLKDSESLIQQMTEAAKAATLESGKHLVGQLLESHKREAEAAKKQSDEAVKQTTEALYQRFEQVTGSVAALGAQVAQTQAAAQTIYRAISHPGGAGRMAEIGLENLLKSFGLEPGRDFIVQYHAEATSERGALRPDAVVFLPGDAALVIDSKASKALLDLAEAEDAEGADAALAKLGQRMALHLKSLVSKEYSQAVLQSYRTLKRGGDVKRTLIAMALPNEGAVEKLRQADPGLERRAAELDIVIAGPSALAAIVAVARMEIDASRQVEDHEKIVEAVRRLMESLGVALVAAEKAAKGLQGVASSFEDFTRSVNARLLPRARALGKWGIRPAKALPMGLPSFVVDKREADLIEGEAEDVSLPLLGNDAKDGGQKDSGQKDSGQ